MTVSSLNTIPSPSITTYMLTKFSSCMVLRRAKTSSQTDSLSQVQLGSTIKLGGLSTKYWISSVILATLAIVKLRSTGEVLFIYSNNRKLITDRNVYETCKYKNKKLLHY